MKIPDWYALMGAEGSAVLVFMLKSVLLLALTGLLVHLARRSASWRHAIWASGLMGLVVLLLVSVSGVEWRWAVLPTTPEVSPVVEVPVQVDAGVNEAALVAHPTAVQGAAPSGGKIDLKWVLLIVWLAGAVAVLLPVLAGCIGLLRLGCSGEVIKGGEARQTLDRLCKEAGLRRRVVLMQHSDAVIPMTWGLLTPRIMLPAGASGWNRAQLAAILSHELGHIKRWDWATMLLGRAVVALNWFNPLAWYAMRRLSIEAEQACDEWVISTGIDSVVYADCLCRVVREARVRPARASLALPLFCGSNFRKRFDMILNGSSAGVLVRRSGLILLGVLTLGIVLPVGALQLGPMQRGQERDVSEGLGSQPVDDAFAVEDEQTSEQLAELFAGIELSATHIELDLSDMLGWFEGQTGVSLSVHWDGLASIGVTRDTSVSLVVEDANALDCLRAICYAAGGDRVVLGTINEIVTIGAVDSEN